MIKIENVSKTYNDKLVLDNINIEINQNELFVLVGPSGSGKSTLLKTINGLVKPDSGQVIIDNVNNNDIDILELRRHIGYVLQNIALFPHLTVYQNIVMLLELANYPKEKRKDRIKELIKAVDLDYDEIINKKPDQLSGGQAQRIGIVRALSFNPKIILMDEPFSSLDPITKNSLQNLILDLQKSFKVTIVFVTHDMNEAAKLGSRIALLKEGKIVQIASYEDLKNKNGNHSLKDFLNIDDTHLSLASIMQQPDGKERHTIAYNNDLAHILEEVKDHQEVNLIKDNKVLGYVDYKSIINILIDREVNLHE